MAAVTKQEDYSQLCKQDEHIKMIDFARNFGHQIAITAGMDMPRRLYGYNRRGSAGSPELIPEMIRIWREGYEVVYGKGSPVRGNLSSRSLLPNASTEF